MTSMDPRAQRAAHANAEDAGATAAELERMLQWHEQQAAPHVNAVATLRKALAFTREIETQHRHSAGRTTGDAA